MFPCFGVGGVLVLVLFWCFTVLAFWLRGVLVFWFSGVGGVLVLVVLWRWRFRVLRVVAFWCLEFWCFGLLVLLCSSSSSACVVLLHLSCSLLYVYLYIFSYISLYNSSIQCIYIYALSLTLVFSCNFPSSLVYSRLHMWGYPVLFAWVWKKLSMRLKNKIRRKSWWWNPHTQETQDLSGPPLWLQLAKIKIKK